MGEAIEIPVAGRSVRLSNPDKVMFSARSETKLDLVNYYLAIQEPFLASLANRPTMMQRFPDGASGKSFYQKRVPDSAPEWLQTTEVATPNGTTSNALVLADMAHVVWAINLGCLGFHPWAYRAGTPEVVDELRLDLDPQPGLSFDHIREAAEETRNVLADFGVQSMPKTSASRGIHVYARFAPRWPALLVRAAAVAVARELERRRPDLLTAAWWKEERGTRVFVDFNQNAPHKTVFGAWSVRARVGAQVSTPFRWEELASIDPEGLTIATVPARVATEGDPWAELVDGQSIELLLEQYRADMEAGRGDAPWPPQYPKMPGEPPRVAPSRAKANPEA